MTADEKLQSLIDMEDRPLTKEDGKFIRKMCLDEDALVRSEATSQLLFVPNCDPILDSQDIDLLIRLCDDPEMIVRTEAYDALSRCISPKVEQKLFDCIQTDKDEISRSFAIFCWADIVSRHAPKNRDYSKEIAFIREWLKTETSEHCRLSCAYALYLFHEKDALEMMLSYLNCEDYRIRCSVIHHFQDSARREDIAKEDIPMIRNTLQQLLKDETTRAVRSCAEKFLKLL